MAAAGFFLGGVMIWILNRLRPVVKGLFLTLAAGVLSWLLLRALLFRLMKKRDEGLRTVCFYVPALGQDIRVRAFVDTGNHLIDPVTGAPVSVISRKTARCLASCRRKSIMPFPTEAWAGHVGFCLPTSFRRW